MDKYSFWQELWDEGIPPWHKSRVHWFLTDYSSNLDFTPPKRVLLPLCGKCLELIWFYEKGLEVVGIELVETPVKDFFKEHNLAFQVVDLSWAKVYETTDKNLKIYISNIYDINVGDVGKFDIIWDRGTQPAIEIEDRERYSRLMKELCSEKFIYMLSTMQHDGDLNKIPRPVSHETTQKTFGDWCNIEIIVQRDITKDVHEMFNLEKVLATYYLLTPK